MRILYLPAYYKPERVASDYLTDNRNTAFAEEGFYMVSYLPTPCRGLSKKERKIYKAHEFRFESYYSNHLTLFRFPMFAEGGNSLMRAFRYFCCACIQLNKGMNAKNIDCIYLASTPPIQGMLGAIIHKCRKIPFVYNLQDIFPDSLVGTGLAKRGGMLWKIGRKIEDFTYRNADKIIVISEDFKKNIMAKGVPEDKIEVVYNWVDEKRIIPINDTNNELFEKYSIPRDKFRVVYAGNLGNAQNIQIIIDAARILRDEDIQFVIFGTGGIESDIKDIKDAEHLDNLMILPLQPYEKVSMVYGIGNVCIVSCKPGLGGAAMPSKTWSILSAGRPVLASFDEGELKSILEQNRCGMFTAAGDVQSFAHTIKKLSRENEECVNMGENGRRFILNNLTKEVGTKKYVDIINDVYRKSKSS